MKNTHPNSQKQNTIGTHDFSPKAIKKALQKYSLGHWSTKYSFTFLTVAALSGLFFTFTETAFAVIIVSLGCGCLSWVYHYFFRGDHFRHQYVEKLQKAIQSETERKRQTIHQELIGHHCEEGARQLDELQRKFDSLVELLGDKLDQSELTYKRYYGIAQEVFLSGIDNLSMVVSALKSISEIEVKPIQERLSQLKESQDPELQEEINALQKRLHLRQNQIEKVKHLLVENEKAMTLIDETQVAIADMDTGQGEAKIDMENSMKALQEIAQRSAAYSQSA